MKLKNLVELLSDYKVENCDIYFLIKVFFNIDGYKIPLKLNKDLDDDKCNFILDKIKAKVPVPYITERVVFRDLTILLNRDTLIPRQETEEMVYRIINALNDKQHEHLKILDLCSGSGAIGLSLAHFFTKSKVKLIDISPSCIEISKKSAFYNEIKNVSFEVSDFLSKENDRYDLIVCNPPYIPTTSQTDTLYEPDLALFAGEDGMDAFRKIFDDLDRVTKKGTLCFFEFESSYASKLKPLFFSIVKEQYQADIAIDLSKKPRFLVIQRL